MAESAPQADAGKEDKQAKRKRGLATLSICAAQL